MHTLIACWQRPTSSSQEIRPSIEKARELMNLWCVPQFGMTEDQIIDYVMKKRRQLDEMDQQFKEGEQADDNVGIMRTGKHLEDRVGSWPSWIYEILIRRMEFDPINKQFFMKNPDDQKLHKLNIWLNKLKSDPLKHFALKYPLTTIRNAFNLTPLKQKLLSDTQYLQIAAIDQPEKGEDGYYHFHDNSFWEGEGQ